jgi:SOS-response transcriptional repressor LexA
MSSARLTINSRPTSAYALALCRDALRAARTGDCAAALGLLTPLWDGVGAEPMTDGLDCRAGAELYHCAGVITSVADQAAGAQREARRLLKHAAHAFRVIGDGGKSIQSWHEVASSYLRSGLFGHARRIARACLKHSMRMEPETEAGLLLVAAVAEWCLGRPVESLATLESAFPLFESVTDEYMSGVFHNTLALAYQNAGLASVNNEYLQRALIEFTAADFYFEKAGIVTHQSSVKNNLGFILSLLGRHEDAHPHLDQARALALSVRDEVQAARVDITRAQVMMAQGRLDDAENVIMAAIETIEVHGTVHLLPEAHSVREAIAERRAARRPLPSNVLTFTPRSPKLPDRFVITVSDDSLINAGIEAEDDVWLRRAAQVQDGDLVYASTPDCMVLAFYYVEGEEVSLFFAHAGCQPRRYPKKAVRVWGVVINR